jgi:hypothetical protein
MISGVNIERQHRALQALMFPCKTNTADAATVLSNLLTDSGKTSDSCGRLKDFVPD